MPYTVFQSVSARPWFEAQAACTEASEKRMFTYRPSIALPNPSLAIEKGDHPLCHAERTVDLVFGLQASAHGQPVDLEQRRRRPARMGEDGSRRRRRAGRVE